MGKIHDSLHLLIKEMNEKLGYDAATLASDGMLSDVDTFIPTGSFMLDMALRGGVPLGRIVEVYGAESAGKTTLAVHLMINNQEAGGVNIFIDSESAFFKDRAIEMGLDPSCMVELEADCVEQGFKHILTMIEKVKEKKELQDTPVLIVWDTIASAPTESEKDDDGTAGMIHKPKVIRGAMRVISRILSKRKATLILLNQVMVNPRKQGYDSPGGFGIKHHASQRIYLKNIGKVEDSRGLVGITCEAIVVKNKIDGPWTKTNRVKMQIGPSGIDDVTSTVMYLTDMKDKEVFQKGAWFKFKTTDEVYSCYGKDIPEIVEKHGMLPWIQKKSAELFLREGPRGFDLWCEKQRRENGTKGKYSGEAEPAGTSSRKAGKQGK